MIRRNFLKLLGVGVSAAPNAIRNAPSSLAFGGDLGHGVMGTHIPTFGKSVTKAELAQKFIKRVMKEVAFGEEYARREARRVYVDSLDADVAPLRSVSLGHKIDMTRKAIVRRRMRSEYSFAEYLVLHGGVDPFWTDDDEVDMSFLE